MTAAELKTLREVLGLPVSWLAKKAGVKDRTVNYWESGKTSVPDDVADLMRDLSARVSAAVNAAVDVCKQSGEKSVLLFRYKTEKELWKHRPDMAGLPVTFHAAMLHMAKKQIEKLGVQVEMMYYGGDSQKNKE